MATATFAFAKNGMFALIAQQIKEVIVHYSTINMGVHLQSSQSYDLIYCLNDGGMTKTL